MNGPLESTPAGRVQFLSTHWSVVVRASQQGSAAAEEALSELCRTYWYPLYGFIRRQGHAPPEAEDLTQQFFALLLEKNYVAEAKQEKGRFRSFLLTVLKRFLANEWDRQHAQKRGGFQTVVEIDRAMAEARLNAELVHSLTPDVLFERQWATALLERVMGRLEEEYVGSGRAKLFQHLRGCLAKGDSARPYREIAAELGLSETAIKTCVHRLRGRYQDLLREEIGNTVSSPSEVEEELRHLFAAFSR
jgi:RNA polymerase sigma factor (sigma-70 family)